MLFGLLIVSMALVNTTAGSEKEGVHLKFSLESKPFTVTVSGKVTDKNSGEPIANAFVRGHVVIWKYKGPDLFEKCPYQETTTDTKGNYQLQFVTPLTTSGPMKGKDSLCVYVSATGYETKPEYGRPAVTPDNTNYPDFNFELGAGKLVKGVVVDEQNNPVEGARVRVQTGQNGDWNFFGALGETYTSENGYFEIWMAQNDALTRRRISPNRWLCILKQGQGTGFFWDILNKEDMGTLTLSSGGNISGRVVNTSGNGIANCELSVRGFPCGVITKTLTDNDGKYILRGIPGDPSIVEFYKKKNNRYMDIWGKVKVYADVNPMMNLRDVPQYEIMAKDGETVAGPDLVVGTDSSVSGKLIASKNALGLGGLMVRLDYSWGNMVEVDAEGNFYFPFVSAGKHRLTAYLPHNLRYDRGIGQAEIEVKAGKPVKDIQIQLENLAELRVQYLDLDGNPLEGITASATWSKNGEGGWTEGTKSDKEGWAVLYLYPDSPQYVRGFDPGRNLVAEGFETVEPQAGQIMGNLQIAMVPSGSISGQLINENNEPFADKILLYKLDFADGVQKKARMKTDSAGHFEIDRLSPGIVKLTIETSPLEFSGVSAEAFEIKPGETKNLNSIIMQKVDFYEVSGRLLPSPTFSNLEGLKIRLDLMQWEPMMPTDSEGNFVIQKVPDGRHRLTAYLPFNLRTDRGVGHVDIEVKNGDLEDAELQLETLATIHMRITDESGKPVEGVSAAAWWTENHSGVFTEGTKSDKEGRAVLYLYPDSLQYVGAHDWSGEYSLEGHKEFNLKEGDIIEGLEIIMCSQAVKSNSSPLVSTKEEDKSAPTADIAAAKSVDRSSPEATVKSWTKAVATGNTKDALACMLPGGVDYDDVREILNAEPSFRVFFVKKMWESIDTEKPIRVLGKELINGKVSIVWEFYFKEDITIEGRTFKRGDGLEFDASLKKHGDYWLIDGI
jgi:protocatechuate 3,4-dioxygenase beta subunit